MDGVFFEKELTVAWCYTLDVHDNISSSNMSLN
jgi:hypothetical protein